MPPAPSPSLVAPATEARSPIRVLLWTLAGSARHYNGPGLMFHRMFSRAEPGRFHVTLAHGYAEQEEDGVYQRYVRLPGSGSRLGQARFTFSGMRWIKRHAREFDVMLALTAYEPSLRPAWYATKSCGLPSAIFLANERYELFPQWTGLRRLLHSPEKRQAMVRDVSAVIAMSANLAQEARDIGVEPSRINFIPNTIDVERFAPVDDAERARRRAEAGLAPGPVVVFCGELSRRKRPHLVVEALRAAFERGRPFSIVFIGPLPDDAYRADLERAVQALPEPNRVRFVGFTKNPEVHYQLGDAFCLPSTNEGMPGALLESMATGLPAILTPFSSAHELVGDGAKGTVVETPEGMTDAAIARGLEEAIAHWTSDPTRLALARRAARETVCERFAVQRTLKEYENLFRRLMAATPSAGRA